MRDRDPVRRPRGAEGRQRFVRRTAGHLRGSSTVDGVALVNEGSTWSLEGTGFERLEGDLGIGRPRLLVANAVSPLLGGWLHDALLRQFVGFDLEVTGMVLAGILRSNGAGSRGRGAFVGTFTARDAGTNVYVGRVVLRLRCTDGAR